MVPSTYLPSYIQITAKASPSVASALSAVLAAGTIVGSLLAGWIADTRVGAFSTAVSSIALCGALQLAIWLPSRGNIGSTFTFAALEGIAMGGYIITIPVVLSQMYPVEELSVFLPPQARR